MNKAFQNANNSSIIIFHLESVSNYIFRMHPELFPNLVKLMGNSSYFTHYFSTSTSTEMVVTDLLYGDSNQFERSNHLENIYSIKPDKQTLLDELYDKGYAVQFVYYGKPLGLYKNATYEQHALTRTKKGESWYGDDRKKMVDCLRDWFEKEPFAVYIQDVESHASYMSEKEKDYLTRYKELDKTLGSIIDVLQKLNIYQQTLIICYGDHGDELFNHGFHNGYFHAIEPFSDLINCPLVIHYPGEKDGDINDKLVSTTDIRAMILGEDYGADFVFSRNLFINEGLRKDSLNKAYTITDGRYLLMATPQGLRMFNVEIDNCNGFNILQMYVLDRGILKYKKYYDYCKSGHFKSFISESMKHEIHNAFNAMYPLLCEHISELYGDAKSGMLINHIDYAGRRFNEDCFGMNYRLLQGVIRGKYHSIKKTITRTKKRANQ